MTAGRRLADALLAGDAPTATALLAEDAVFHSPVADYPGRERIAPVFAAIPHVVTDARPTRVLEDGDVTATFFTATAADRQIDGVLRVVDTRDITLMIRPLSALLPAVEEMKRRLAA